MQNHNQSDLKSFHLNHFTEKVELILREVHINRQNLITINTIDEFISNKIKFTQFFFDIEDYLREFLQKLNISYINNKESSDKNDLLTNKLRNLENKILNTDKINEDYKQNTNNLLNQINFLNEKQFKNENYIFKLEEKIKKQEKNSDNFHDKNQEGIFPHMENVRKITNNQHGDKNQQVLYGNENNVNVSEGNNANFSMHNNLINYNTIGIEDNLINRKEFKDQGNNSNIKMKSRTIDYETNENSSRVKNFFY